MRLPSPRGPLSDALMTLLRDGVPEHDRAPELPQPSDEEDFQLSLWELYELHYRGFDEVEAKWEWNPGLLSVRATLERTLEATLREGCRSVVALASCQGSLVDKLVAITDYESGCSLPTYLQRDATREQYLEFLIQRSIYHLKESDPHAWVVPRIDGAAKVALAELQYDEFGAGRPDQLHSRLFADALESGGLDPAYGAYIDRVPSPTLAVNNAMSLFGLHRRLRGAAVGHLAAFEMTSSLPCRRYLQGAERLEMAEPVCAYFDEHVEADAVHEHLAARAICAELVEQAPHLEGDVLLGAATCVWLDGIAAGQMIDSWSRSRSSLRPVVSEAVA